MHRTLRVDLEGKVVVVPHTSHRVPVLVVSMRRTYPTPSGSFALHQGIAVATWGNRPA
jgi:hypothetical protein